MVGLAITLNATMAAATPRLIADSEQRNWSFAVVSMTNNGRVILNANTQLCPKSQVGLPAAKGCPDIREVLSVGGVGDEQVIWTAGSNDALLRIAGAASQIAAVIGDTSTGSTELAVIGGDVRTVLANADDVDHLAVNAVGDVAWVKSDEVFVDRSSFLPTFPSSVGAGRAVQINDRGELAYRNGPDLVVATESGMETRLGSADNLVDAGGGFHLKDDGSVQAWVTFIRTNGSTGYRLIEVDPAGNRETLVTLPEPHAPRGLHGDRVFTTDANGATAVYFGGDLEQGRLFGEGDELFDLTVCQFNAPVTSGAGQVAARMQVNCGSPGPNRFIVARFDVNSDVIGWINPDGGDYLDPSNWDPEEVPGQNDPDVTALFSLSRVKSEGRSKGSCEYDVTGNATSVGRVVADGDCELTWRLSGSFETTSELQTSLDVARDATINISAGSLLSRGAVIGSLGTPQTMALMRLLNSGTTWRVQNELRIGEGSPGHLFVSNGSKLTTDLDVFVGEFSTGRLTVNAESEWDSKGPVNLAEGVIVVDNDAKVVARQDVFLGDQSVGTLEVLASEWTSVASVTIGEAEGDTGVLRIGEGALFLVDGLVSVGEMGSGDVRVFDPTSVLFVRGGLFLGGEQNAQASLTVDSGASVDVDEELITLAGTSNIEITGCDGSTAPSRPSQLEVNGASALGGDVAIQVSGGARVQMLGSENSYGADSSRVGVIGDDEPPAPCGGQTSVWFGGPKLTVASPINVRSTGVLAATELVLNPGARVFGQGCLSDTLTGTVCDVDVSVPAAGPQPKGSAPFLQIEGGELAPGRGLDVGRLRVDGSVVQGSGRVMFEMRGPDPQAQDRLEVSGDVVLNGGQLVLRFISGYAPTSGTTLIPIEADSVTVANDLEVVIEGLEPGFEYQLSVESGNLVLNALTDGVFADAIFSSGFEAP